MQERDQIDRRSQEFVPLRALALGADLCAGLAHIHRAGMLHRDIKPSNIAFAGNAAVHAVVSR